MASDNVVPLPGSLAGSFASKLEEVLSEARAGRFVALAIVGVTTEGRTFTASAPAQHHAALIGALERAKFDILSTDD